MFTFIVKLFYHCVVPICPLIHVNWLCTNRFNKKKEDEYTKSVPISLSAQISTDISLVPLKIYFPKSHQGIRRFSVITLKNDIKIILHLLQTTLK